MTIATKNGVPIVKGGVIASNCGCCLPCPCECYDAEERYIFNENTGDLGPFCTFTYIRGEKTITVPPDVEVPCRVTISGSVNDDFVVNGEAIQEGMYPFGSFPCNGAHGFCYSFTTDSRTFTVAVKDNFGSGMGADVKIRFCGSECGACCESDGTCNVRPQRQCQGAGQTFRGVGTVCTPNPCDPCTNYRNITAFTGIIDGEEYLFSRTSFTGSSTGTGPYTAVYTADRHTPAQALIGPGAARPSVVVTRNSFSSTSVQVSWTPYVEVAQNGGLILGAEASVTAACSAVGGVSSSVGRIRMSFLPLIFFPSAEVFCGSIQQGSVELGGQAALAPNDFRITDISSLISGSSSLCGLWEMVGTLNYPPSSIDPQQQYLPPTASMTASGRRSQAISLIDNTFDGGAFSFTTNFGGLSNLLP